MITRLALLAATASLLGGCVSTVATVVTAPVKAVGKVVDWTTTSRDEADRNRGRAYRKAETKARKACRRSEDGDAAIEACVSARLRAAGFS